MTVIRPQQPQELTACGETEPQNPTSRPHKEIQPRTQRQNPTLESLPGTQPRDPTKKPNPRTQPQNPTPEPTKPVFCPRPGSPHSKKQTPMPPGSQHNLTPCPALRNRASHLGNSVQALCKPTASAVPKRAGQSLRLQPRRDGLPAPFRYVSGATRRVRRNTPRFPCVSLNGLFSASQSWLAPCTAVEAGKWPTQIALPTSRSSHTGEGTQSIWQ